MKKLKVLFVIVFCMFLIPSVYAGEAYVDEIKIDANINTDGSMTVKETINWSIVEDLNGVYRNILIKNPSNLINSATSITVDSIVVDGKEFNYSYTTLQNGTDGKYNINEIENGKQIKIFTPSSDEYRETVITYTLYDVIVEYNDIAELYWNFVGEEWEDGIDDVVINVKLPGNSDVLKIFAHGPLHGYSSLPTLDSATVEVARLRSGEQVDIRLLFDKSLVETSKVVAEDKLDSILALEEQLALQANIKRENAKKALYVSLILVAISLIIPLITYVIFKKNSYKVTFKGKYYRELPEDYGPAVMNKVIHGVTSYVSSCDMLATVLDLVRKRYIEIETIYKESKKGKKNPKDYRLKLIKTDLQELSNVEKHLIEELIFVDTTEITLKELSEKNSKTMKEKTKATKAFEKWGKIIEQEAKDKDLIKKQKYKISKYILACVFALILSMGVVTLGITMGYDDVIGIGAVAAFFGIYELIFVVLKITDINSRTQKSVEHKAMWKAFKKFLQDFSKLDERDYKSIAIWEHYLVYATGLGIAKKVIKQLKIVFPSEFDENSEMFGTYATISILSDSSAFSNFESSFSSATSDAFSAPSSADGSGGGLSGGAGGRRRRWWRRRILASESKIILLKLIKQVLVSFFLYYVENSR